MRLALASGTPVEIAEPQGPPARGVVVFPDVGGLRPLFDELAARLARQHHWSVAVVDPFGGRAAPTIDDRLAAMPAMRDDRILGDAVAAADLLAERGAGPVAVMGFCMGGMYTYKAAGSGSFDAAVSFYGMIRVPATWRGPAQGEPLELLAGPLTCRVLAVIGGRDPYTPGADVAELERFGGLVTPLVFPDAEHGFVHDPARPTHRGADAAAAWDQVTAFLA